MSGLAVGATADSPPRSSQTDEELMQRLTTGHDEDALSELYDRYQAAMYGIAMRVTNNAAMAQDAVQEAFLGIWRNAARYSEGRASARTWMLSICHHRAVDLVRRRRPVSPLPEVEQANDALTIPDVWAEVARTLEGEAIRSAMSSLPEAQREAIDLAYFRGLTQVEIAERTGAPLGTVKSRVRLGLLQLRRNLDATQ